MRTLPPPLHRSAARVLHLARPLRGPAFRRLYASQVVSELGDWAARLALSVLVFDRTGSAATAGVATAVSLLPWLGPGQLLTALGERWPRRRVLVASDAVRAVAFGVAALPLPVPLLLLVVFLAGLASPPFSAARSALRPEVVPPPLFPSAVALCAITEDVAVAAGYLLGGALIALLGAQGALVFNAVSFAASALLLRGLPDSAPVRRPARGQLRAAARHLAADPVVRRAAGLVLAVTAAGAALTAMAAPLVVEELHAGPGTVAWLVALSAAVSILGTAALPLGEHPPERLLGIGAGLAVLGGAGTSACFAALALTGAPRLPLAAAGFAAGGVLFVVVAVANVVVAPRLAPELRASALALLMGTLVAAEAAGAAGAGLAASVAGLLPVLVAAGVPPLAVGAWALHPAAVAALRRTDAVGSPGAAAASRPRPGRPPGG